MLGKGILFGGVASGETADSRRTEFPKEHAIDHFVVSFEPEDRGSPIKIGGMAGMAIWGV
jgi:hypothetical protein